MENPSTKLPVPPTALIGREAEIRYAHELLGHEDVRLVTLTGPGGSGKTRLGVDVAANTRGAFRDGLFFVDLAPIRNPVFVLPAISQALGGKAEKMQAALYDKQCLIFLDNFEQVIQAASDISGLLAACPEIKILATSREELRIRGEYILPVAPLPLPTLFKNISSADIAQFPAIELFVQRAQSVTPDFFLNDENALVIAEICIRLDGLPLAIELAAAQIRLFPPAVFLKRLEQGLKMISGPRDLPARQQTLRSTFDWSYDLLTPREKILLMRLSVFRGGATLEAIREISGSNGDEFLDGLDSLVSKNMLRQTNTPLLQYVMLETIREWALEKLEISGEAEIIRRRHAVHFLNLAKEAFDKRWTLNHTQWLDRLESEEGNLHEALRWAAENDRRGLFLDLTANLWLFWSMRGPLAEGLIWLDLAAKECDLKAGGIESELAVNVLVGASELARYQGDFEKAIQWKQKILEICRDSGDESWVPAILHDLAIIHAEIGDCERSLSFAQEAVELRQKQGNTAGIAHALGALFFALMCNGDLAGAYAAIGKASKISRDHQNPERLVTDLIMLMHIAIRQRRYEDARYAFEEFLPMVKVLADQEAIASGIHAMGILAAAKRNSHQAARLLGAADEISLLGGFRFEIPGRMWVLHTTSEAKTRIRETAWNKEYDAGRALVKSTGSVLEVLRILEEHINKPSGSGKSNGHFPAGMTARELEILRLVAQGLTDNQVAQTLVISPRTVNAHLTSIYNKIGVKSRSAATRFAIEQGLDRS
ncbi:MAG: tetratricopeptide repeat protein [Anaerolineales bacterium]|nr:tetratricopeptide repeat protein [Anaerolineales bacterium]